MPAARKAWRLMILVGMGAVAFAVWPRSPALVLYTWPPITLDKKTFRLQALVPEGWRSDGQMIRDSVTWETPGRSWRVSSCLIVVLPPNRPCPWIPEWLRTRLFGAAERGDVSLVAWAPSLPSVDFTDIGVIAPKYDGYSNLRGGFTAYHALHSLGSVGFEMSYSRSNRAAFADTQRRICESFRVIK